MALLAAASSVHWGQLSKSIAVCEAVPELRLQNMQGTSGAGLYGRSERRLNSRREGVE